ncbi:thiamine-phosphate kinase [Endothiovibrio diazotrophicus]
MSLSEFGLIERFFTRPSRRAGVALGVGDDAALLRVPAGMELAVTVDTLVAGVHFPEENGAAEIAHKALAVNLSDLASMGAEPAWVTLALTLPEADEAWLAAFAEGFFELADHHGVALIGGDTTRGPLSITVQAHGLVPHGQALRRDGARAGDGIYLTGTVGDAALGLADHFGKRALEGSAREYCRERLHRPWPRVLEGIALRGVASACIDVSDGVAADLGHILRRSGCGARIDASRLPLSEHFAAAFEQPEEGWRVALSGGDDYELLFCVPEARAVELARQLPADGCTRIGEILREPGLRCVDGAGRKLEIGGGYLHFG